MRSTGTSLNSTPDHTPKLQRKDKEDEVQYMYMCMCMSVYKLGCAHMYEILYIIICKFKSCDFCMNMQAASLYWMGVAAEQSGDMHAGE